MKLVPSDVDAAQHELFQQLMAENQRALFLYILTMVPQAADAEDVLQETNITAMRNAGDFELGSNFRAWVFRVAYYVTLQYRQRKHRESLTFDSDLVDTLASEASQESERLQSRRDALAHCMEQLRHADRLLLLEYYRAAKQRGDIADRMQRPLGSIYKSISRIRKNLLRCVTRRITSEERA